MLHESCGIKSLRGVFQPLKTPLRPILGHFF
jgi:hypothetical protein